MNLEKEQYETYIVPLKVKIKVLETRSKKLEAENKKLLVIKELAHDWSANYPLGGGMDEQAARDIYLACMQIRR